jgi:hypothetical protein
MVAVPQPDTPQDQAKAIPFGGLRTSKIPAAGAIRQNP